MRQVPYWLRRLIGEPVLAWKSRQLRDFCAGLADARGVQERRLVDLLQGMTGSAFANDHGLKNVRTVTDLRKALPIAPYERMAPYVDRVAKGDTAALFADGTQVLMLALTSGTGGDPKRIPVTRRSLEEYRRSWTVWGCGLAKAHPRVPFAGVLNLASSWQVGRSEAGLPCGSISGMLFNMMHSTLGITNVVPPLVSRVEEPELRQYLALRLALTRRDTMMVTTANPSTLVSLARRLGEWKDLLCDDLRRGELWRRDAYPPDVLSGLEQALEQRHLGRAQELMAAARRSGTLRPKDAWPALELLGVWTGGTLTPYLRQLNDHYGDIARRDHGLSASEGRFTIPLEDGTNDGPLNIDGAFYEFLPEDSAATDVACDTLLAHELEIGHNYKLIVTTSGGLVRYDMQDIVRCTGFMGTTPRLSFLHKGAQIASLTGEKLSAHQVVEAAQRAQDSAGTSILEFTLAPVFDEPPAYHLLIERGVLPTGERGVVLLRALDAALIALNMEYADKRRSARLGPVRMTPVADGTFARWRAERLAKGGTLEQYKHPFLVTDPELAQRHALAQGRLSLRRSG